MNTTESKGMKQCVIRMYNGTSGDAYLQAKMLGKT